MMLCRDTASGLFALRGQDGRVQPPSRNAAPSLSDGKASCPGSGFTLFELLIALAIITVMWGIGISAMPRLLSGSGPDALARRLAGAGQEARQMAMLQQRPWELLLDLDQGLFYRAPLGAVSRRELRATDQLGDGSLDPATRGGSAFFDSDVRRGASGGQDLVALRRAELDHQPMHTLRVQRGYDRLAFTHDDTDSDIFESSIPEAVRIIQVWTNGGHVETGGRVSLVFGPRGFIQPTVLWFEAADRPGKDRYTLHFPGILPPVVLGGTFLPDENGVLTPVESAW